ncbi:universal stress protein [Actinoplanes utahensis]|uniref:universal stress protein n=1 Tax=Actinoplanes utahensis TaxID=1869 RepID=UPI0006907BA4|nr:universal stress protein [Actinoplanes utahensis]GIF27725.1 universal stress protein [Actinoplanes utahensis]
MQIPSEGPVVVGAGRVPGDAAAVRFAAREAASRGRPLRVVHAFTGPGDAGYGPARRLASQVVGEAVAIAQRSTPGLDVRGQIVDGPPGRVLLNLSRTAVLLVVGGSLIEVVAGAWCPVAVSRAPRTPAGPIVAAVDASPYSVLAVRFAAETARRRGGPLHLVHVTDPDHESAAARVLDEMAAQAPGAVEVRHHLFSGPPAGILPRVTRRVGLLVLGPRSTCPAGRLGTVAEAVLRHATCPTVFVHGARLRARYSGGPQLSGSPVTA